ncbi:MAG: hypothetical protein QOF21_2279 [Actinomycetota bacterium]|jgi:hypothetical protein
MRRRVLRALGLVAWMLAWPVAGAFGQSTDTALDKYGWWNANQTLPADPTGGALPPLEVPPPPGAPADGLYVESAVNGSQLAIAAVTFFTGGGVNASLTLALAEGSSSAGVTIAACPAGGGWDAAQNGRWDRRPTYDPATCTFLGIARDNTVTFAIPAAAHEPGSSYLSLAIVPAEGSGAFAASFMSPTSASLVTTPAAATSAPSATPSPVFAPGPVTFGGDAYAAPIIGSLVGSPPASAAGERAAPPSRSAGRSATTTDDQGSARAIAVVALAVIAATLFASARRTQRPPRLIGSLAVDAAPDSGDVAKKRHVAT